MPAKAPAKAKEPEKKRDGLRIQDPVDARSEKIQVLSSDEEERDGEEGEEEPSSPIEENGSVRGHHEGPYC